MADVIDIDKLPSRFHGRYALQSHFDFCICDDAHQPAFVIEYDGGGHRGANDALKDEIANAANLALFRVSEALLNRSRGGVTFLQYLVHTYFLADQFQRWREEGYIDPSEPFMMSGFLKDDAKNIFDSDFNYDGVARGRLNGILRRQGWEFWNIQHLKIADIVLGKNMSNFVSFSTFPVGGDTICGRAFLNLGLPSLGRLGELPFGPYALADYCVGMGLEDLCDALETYFSGGGHTLLTRPQVEEEMVGLKASGYRLLRGGGGADAWLLDVL
jgi:hypothetical protein